MIILYFPLRFLGPDIFLGTCNSWPFFFLQDKWPCFNTINKDHPAVKDTQNTDCPIPICIPTPIRCYPYSHMFPVYHWWRWKEQMPSVDSAGKQEGLFKPLSLVLILSLTRESTITILYLSQPVSDASWEANMYSNIPETSCLLWKRKVLC
jgi:hypothetical protein